KLKAQRPVVESVARDTNAQFATRIAELANAALDDIAAEFAAVQATRRQTVATAAFFIDPVWKSWAPPSTVREVLWHLQSIPIGVSAKVGTRLPTGIDGTTRWRLPVITDFRGVPGFAWRGVSGSSLETSTAHCRALVLRLMAAVPPGKARFTFIDPLGSG